MTKSRQSKISALLHERQQLLQELSSLSCLIRGSFFQRFSTCSRPTCNCHKGQRHGPRSYVAVTQAKIQKQHYIPIRQVELIRDGIRQFHRLLEIVDRITVINLNLMNERSLHETNI